MEEYRHKDFLHFLLTEFKENTGHNSSRIKLFNITHVQANGQAVNELTQDALADAELKEEVKHLKSMLEQETSQMADQSEHCVEQQAIQMAD
ncbi:hypothetical protein CFP56_012005 [Quercus suber]|uniref:Uncharacterized protein n=1 Tax=Quercus suber TaxID=58331 RepID=A0AAW0L0A6_QUESU